MPMPNTNAPITSDGPIGAIAPPKPGTSAATGTMTVEATAMSSNTDSSPPASPLTRKRRHAAVNENSALRNATPSAKPRITSAAEASCPSSATSATSTAVPSTAAIRNGQSSRGNEDADVSSVVVVINLAGKDYDPRPSVVFRSSDLVPTEASGRVASAVQSTMDP